MFSFLANPTATTVLEVYITFQVYSAAVQSLPNPSTFGGVWYKALYGFLSVLAADFKSYAGTIPGFPPTGTTKATGE